MRVCKIIDLDSANLIFLSLVVNVQKTCAILKTPASFVLWTLIILAYKFTTLHVLFLQLSPSSSSHVWGPCSFSSLSSLLSQLACVPSCPF